MTQQKAIPMVALSRHRYRDKWILEGEPFFAVSEADADDFTGIRPPIARHLTSGERAKLATVQNPATIEPTRPAPAPQQASQQQGNPRQTISLGKKR